jgi:hypothetical protein
LPGRQLRRDGLKPELRRRAGKGESLTQPCADRRLA